MGRGLLISVAGFLVVYGMIQLSINDRKIVYNNYGVEYSEHLQSENISSALTEMAMAKINETTSTNNSGSTSNQSFMGGTGSVNIMDSTDANDQFHTVKIIETTATYNDKSKSVYAEMNKKSFSRFAYFTQVEPNIYFTTGDTINGPLHTNGELHISGDPVFNGKVSSPNAWVGSGNPEFNEGADFDVESINLPSDLSYLVNAAQNSGIRYNDALDVTFLSSGEVQVTQGTKTADGYWSYGTYYPPTYSWGTTQTIDLNLINGIISAGTDVLVKGDLDGNVLVHAQENIRIMGDLIYVNSPRNNAPSDDYLGLVAQGNVSVEKNAHSYSGTSDVVIMASLMALNKSFWVENYNDGISRGQLNVYGGIIQQERGPVGLTNGSGFSKKYEYDNRLIDMGPIGYPRSDSYAVKVWDQKF